MTLKELQNKIEKTMGKDLPTAAYLRAGNSPLVASRELDGGTKLSVYQNGFALYQTNGGSTVFRVDYCGGYTYFGRNEQTELSEDFFAGTDWWVRLLLEGEDRLTHNRNVMVEKYECFYEGDSEAFYNICGTENTIQDEMMQSELLEQAFSIMTKRQREVVKMYYLDGLGVEEIGAVFGISHQAVSVTLSDVRKKFQKNRKNFE
jgi:RNA polymerase sigma factor (sigma-70 family)